MTPVTPTSGLVIFERAPLPSGTGFTGAISEVALFKDTVLSTTDRQLLEANQGNYYGVTVNHFDLEAQAYITAVETADGQALEQSVKVAINSFVVGCKADGIWEAIKSSCIMAGARTLAGALVPLKGTAPTNFNFVSGDYNRKTGLKGDGNTKSINTNRPGNSDPQNNNHMGVWVSVAEANNIVGTYIGHGLGLSMASHIFVNKIVNLPEGDLAFRSRTGVADVSAGRGSSTGLIGLSRSSSTDYLSRDTNETTVRNQTAQGVLSLDNFVFARSDINDAPQSYTNARISFYSIGESLDLTLLDTRVTNLISEIDTAI
jgi:hypothetical protein